MSELVVTPIAANSSWYVADAAFGIDDVYAELARAAANGSPVHRVGVYLASAPDVFDGLPTPESTDVVVTSHLRHADEVLRRSLTWARDHDVGFAVAGSPAAHRWLNSRAAHPLCASRFIVLRVGRERWPELTGLELGLAPFRGPAAPALKPLSRRSVLHLADRHAQQFIPAGVEELASTLGLTVSGKIAENPASAAFLAKSPTSPDEFVVKLSRRGVYAGLHGRSDAAAQRLHDHAIRAELAGRSGAPEPVALRCCPDGVVSIETRAAGFPLSGLVMGRNPIYNGRSGDRRTGRVYTRLIARVMLQVLRVLSDLHAIGTTHGDLAPSNIIIDASSDGTLSAVLVDYEFAASKSRGRCVSGRTTGYSRPARLRDDGNLVADDLHAFGRVVLSSLIGIQNLGELDVDVMTRAFRAESCRLGLEPGDADAMIDLLRRETPTEADRRSWEDLLRSICDYAVASLEAGEPAKARSWDSRTDPQAIAGQIVATRSPDTDAVLFPGDPAAYCGMGASFGYGSAGVIATLAACGYEVRKDWVDWTVRHAATRGTTRPGLLGGALGTLWGISAHIDPVQLSSLTSLLKSSDGSVRRTPGVAAELSALELKLGLESGDRGSAAVVTIGDLPTVSQICDELCSVDPEALVAANGPLRTYSGVSVSAALLLAATVLGHERYYAAGLRFARHMLDKSFPGDRERASTSLLDGRAGVLGVAIRYAFQGGDTEMIGRCHELAEALAGVHPLQVGVHTGLAGIGLALLDCRDLTRDSGYQALLARVTERLDALAVPTAGGLAFPGATLSRLSNDYATGSAGPLAYYHRLAGIGPVKVTHPILQLLEMYPAASLPCRLGPRSGDGARMG
ncbi:hypothetical protein ACFCV3_00460 [Kribbella sp. NPDC056345]|uniref:hypothetical protein n=1 Tax=Kribbella sp. NPDC056345 TaxID=3345789 RepID=UPI0035E002B1